MVRSGHTSTELIKVILASLDYSRPKGTEGCRLPRLILETALTAGREIKLRKWATKFLSLLAGLNFSVITASTANRYEEEREIGEYAIKLAIRQLADPSRKVVKAAARVLCDWIEKYPRCLRTLYSFKLDQLNDETSYRLLEALCFMDEALVEENLHRAEAILVYWIETFNIKYIQLVEERLNASLLGVKRKAGSGGFARSSMERSHKSKSLRLPLHLYGSLARHSTGQQLLLRHQAVIKAMDCLEGYELLSNSHRGTPTEGSMDKGVDAAVKSALLSIAQLISNLSPALAISLSAQHSSVMGKAVSDHFSPRVINAALRVIMRFSNPQSRMKSSIWGMAIWALKVVETGGKYGRRQLEAIRKAEVAFPKLPFALIKAASDGNSKLYIDGITRHGEIVFRPPNRVTVKRSKSV